MNPPPVTLALALEDDRSAYEPGDELGGMASWSGEPVQSTIEVRLFWYTKGRGTTDGLVIQTIPFAAPLASESRRFRLKLPQGPYTFVGQLVSLVWALELVALPAREAARVDIVIAPGGRAIVLPSS